MIHPSYNELLKTLNEVRDENEPEIDSRYSLVIASAKRACRTSYTKNDAETFSRIYLGVARLAGQPEAGFAGKAG